MNARLELPDWKRPPRGSDHYCGPPFGLPPRALDSEKTGELPKEIEGIGIGKCIGVLWGPVVGREELPGGQLRRTRVGGHQGSVLSAVRLAGLLPIMAESGPQDFHPRRPLIATCGVSAFESPVSTYLIGLRAGGQRSKDLASQVTSAVAEFRRGRILSHAASNLQ